MTFCPLLPLPAAMQETMINMLSVEDLGRLISTFQIDRSFFAKQFLKCQGEQRQTVFDAVSISHYFVNDTLLYFLFKCHPPINIAYGMAKVK